MSRFDPKPGEACRACGVVSNDFRQRACVNCTVAKGLYRRYGTGREEAHKLVAREIRAGRLPPAKTLACADCGKPAFAYEHRDYNQPLMVEPICRSCNGRRGAAIPKKMTFKEFVAVVQMYYPTTVEADLEMIRQWYWPNE
jgi:ribosomal protein L37E